MIVEINDTAKTITITQADGKELKKLIKKYPNYLFVSKVDYNYGWWGTQPYSIPYTSPTYVGDITTVSSDSVIGTNTKTNDNKQRINY